MILKKQRQQKTDTKGLTVRHCNFFHVQIHCACQWIMTLPPKILWPTALLNTWNIITFPKSSFYHTNHTFLTNINVWMMDFSSINTRIKKISSAQNTILCREWLLQKLTFRHSEITIFNHSHNPTQRTFGEPQAPSVYNIYIYMYVCLYAKYVSYMLSTWRIKWPAPKNQLGWKFSPLLLLPKQTGQVRGQRCPPWHQFCCLPSRRSFRATPHQLYCRSRWHVCGKLNELFKQGNSHKKHIYWELSISILPVSLLLILTQDDHSGNKWILK